MELLEKYSIKYLVDIRSRPYSRYAPQYNREAFAAFLHKNNISYVYMGDLLGGHPNDAGYYTDGRINYDKIWLSSFYRQGIARLVTAYEKQLSVALMCAEAKPQNCHRSRMVAPGLVSQNIPVMHIDELGTLKSHEEISSLLKQPNAKDNTLFSPSI